jgi:protein AbiQ
VANLPPFCLGEFMSKSIKISGVQSVYLEYLRQYDGNVSRDPTQNRKFVGVILEIEGHNYLAPLSSPKEKHALIADKALDVYKLDGGTLGIVNLNNMIPVLKSTIIDIDIAKEKDNSYRNLLNKQVLFLRADEELIKKKAKKLYQIVNSGKQSKLNVRCCKYKLLEQMSLNFGIVLPTTIQEIAADK